MATPCEITIDKLNGNWILNKKLSTEIDPIFKLQGINWLLRKAVALTDICLKISTSHTNEPEPITTIEFLQTSPIGKLASTTEKRVLNGEVRYHSDYIFGTVTSQSCFVQGSSEAENVGLVKPELGVQTKSLGSDLVKFLSGEITFEDRELFTHFGGFLVEGIHSGQRKTRGRGLWVHTFERSIHSGWEAEQTWGFEMINGNRCFTRRVVVTSAEGKHVYARLVYDFIR
ncbi:hypothetical protein N7478_001083 [Penicillium angulare]|uniref:uncharacterized protein n=1 Tax=Penicillium angulare TaxID=116970 RepID=UPI00253FBD32|nr:uncharacterized protein N7478_001083 [Penicillium angulare]KAJ5291832.1 hypothetical protein N7478_001083 [Penicillium angulare]